MPSTGYQIKPLPENALSAVCDGLKPYGFTPTMIKENYAFSGRDGILITVNALVFTHEIHRIFDYTGITLFNPANGADEPNHESNLARILAQSAAPFHLIYRDRKESFSFWFSNVNDRNAREIEPVLVESDINCSKLSEVLNRYDSDIRPQRIIDVKQGRAAFTHPCFCGPSQLSLWAMGVTADLLVRHFGHAVNKLRTYRDSQSGSSIPDQEVTDLAIQLLGATILAHTGVLGDDIRQHDPPLDDLISRAFDKFRNYFNPNLIKRWDKATGSAYKVMTELRYTGFAPDMLKELYKQAYPAKEARKKLGRYDTPLYLTRRIWNAIPVEFLPPEQRITADMTCGWGSFLIAGYERLSHLIDMRQYSLREFIYGNDSDDFTARLAGLGLLLSTSDDSWHINHQDAMKWEWLEHRRPNIIVGNPPFGGDRKKEIDKECRHQEADRFLDRAIDCLAPGGYLAMLMPQSFTAAEASPRLRKKLLENCDVQELWDLPDGTFPDAKTNIVVIFAQKKHSLSISAFPVRARTLQQNMLQEFEKSGPFTASGVVISQSNWGVHARKSKGSKNTHIMDYHLILAQTTWDQIRYHCVNLKEVAFIFSGLTRGTPSKGRYYNHTPSEEIKWFSNWKKTVPRAFFINYTQFESARYPNDFQWPRIKNRGLFKGPKILLISLPNPSWGKRVKVALERHRYFVSNGFWPIARKPDIPNYLNEEVIAAVLDWHVCNAWLIEHLKSPWTQRRTVETMPFPANLTREDCQMLTEAVGKIEEAAKQKLARPAESTQVIDCVLKRAYQLDDETFQRLVAVAEWGTNPCPTTLDTQPDPAAKWETTGVVDKVDAEKGTITLWMSDFDELQVVPISPVMPGWLLRSEAAFRTTIPRACVRQHSLKNVSWGKFYPQDYTYLTEEELFNGLRDILS